MGLLRGGTLFFVCSLLFLSLILMNSLLIVSSSLEYDNFRESVSPLVQEISNPSSDLLGKGVNEENLDLNQTVNEAIEKMQTFCQTNPDYVFNFSNYSIKVPCSSLSGGKEAVLNQSVERILYETYYKDYQCDFWDCFGKEPVPTFLISLKAHDYWKQKFYFSILISFVLSIFAFLLIERRSNWPIVVGGLVVVSSIAVVKIRNLVSVFVPENPKVISVIFDSFFTQTMKVVFTVAIFGIILLCIGIGFRIWTSEFVQSRLGKSEKETGKKINKEKKK